MLKDAFTDETFIPELDSYWKGSSKKRFCWIRHDYYIGGTIVPAITQLYLRLGSAWYWRTFRTAAVDPSKPKLLKAHQKMLLNKGASARSRLYDMAQLVAATGIPREALEPAFQQFIEENALLALASLGETSKRKKYQ